MSRNRFACLYGSQVESFDKKFQNPRETVPLRAFKEFIAEHVQVQLTFPPKSLYFGGNP